MPPEAASPILSDKSEERKAKTELKHFKNSSFISSNPLSSDDVTYCGTPRIKSFKNLDSSSETDE